MDLFAIGQKLSLLFTKENTLVEMICEIEGIHDDRLDIILPQYFMRYIEYLQVGCRVTIKVFTKTGTIDFNSIVISSPLEDYFSVELDYNALQLTPGEDVPAVGAIENIEIKSAEGTFKLKTFELSSEHVKFTSNHTFKLDETIDCTISFPEDYGIINFRAVISDIDAVYDNEYTASYMTMTEADRQTLLYYMYVYSKDTD